MSHRRRPKRGFTPRFFLDRLRKMGDRQLDPDGGNPLGAQVIDGGVES